MAIRLGCGHQFAQEVLFEYLGQVATRNGGLNSQGFQWPACSRCDKRIEVLATVEDANLSDGLMNMAICIDRVVEGKFPSPLCKLSRMIMRVPAFNRACGHVFEKRMLEAYVTSNQKCPEDGCGRSATLQEIVVHYKMRDTITGVMFGMRLHNPPQQIPLALYPSIVNADYIHHLATQNNLICSTHYQLFHSPYQLQCGHRLEETALVQILENEDSMCPQCRDPIEGYWYDKAHAKAVRAFRDAHQIEDGDPNRYIGPHPGSALSIHHIKTGAAKVREVTIIALFWVALLGIITLEFQEQQIHFK
ncbi:MAG: hypothetical protein S4CHLAM102_01550 [Chlamydiia bacterium]|nr:hypothetical protein [Chlamydiia bacterium]